MSAPFYWMYETSGVLRPAIEAYLRGGPMTEAQICAEPGQPVGREHQCEVNRV